MEPLGGFEASLANVKSPSFQVPKGHGYRHKMAYMISTAFVVSYCLRFNLSMAIIGMVNSDDDETESHNPVCTNLLPDNSSSPLKELTGREFNWSAQMQGIILALVIPTAAWAGEKYLIAVRVFQGMAEGVVGPAGYVLLAQWSPPDERSQLGSIAVCGNQGGALLAMLLSGLMIYTNELSGWPGIFYLSGGIGIMICISWCLFAYNQPWDNPDISAAELEYIQGSLGDQISKKYVPTPWAAMFRSKAVWAIIIAQTGNGWGLLTLLTGLPAYFSKILHYDVRQNSWLSGLPFLGMVIVALISGYLATKLIRDKVISTVTARRIFNTIGHWIPALAFLSLAFINCDRIYAVSMIFIGVSVSGAVSAGYQINHIDIAPQHAGVLMGICNFAANISVWVSPFFIGKLNSEDGLRAWQTTFLVLAGILFVDNLFFLLTVSGSEQSFNRKRESQATQTS